MGASPGQESRVKRGWNAPRSEELDLSGSSPGIGKVELGSVKMPPMKLKRRLEGKGC